MKKLIPFSFAIAALAFAITASAEDWPEFRGPTGQGISAERNLPVEWSGTKNVVWKQPVPGSGWSSPVVVDKRVYLTTAVPSGDGQSLRALGLDAASGKILWNTELFAKTVGKAHKKNSQASPTPLVYGGRLYVHFGPQGTACLDLNGKILWRNDALDYPPVHGNGGSPILVDDLLVFSCDAASDPFVVALDKNTGKVRWKVNRATTAKRKFSFSTPLLATVNGQKQIITPGSGVVCGLDPANGKELWRTLYGEGYSVIPRPVLGHGLIFISSGYDKPNALAIRAGGRGDVTSSAIVWTSVRGAPHTPSMLLVGAELYMVSDGGIASCADAKTGNVHWQERVEGNFSASPVFADGRIYLQSEEGVGVVLQPGKEFKVLARNALNERTLASYAISDGAIFIRSAQNLYRIQKR
ncbi:MAG: PQQ-binding-like beta-propeller repeat protein [Verrucomicrobia bacterium]|nr:PQQ-binding-like beta-propeller repeat protein [Verrucomicrobiota bacterium]